MLSKIRNDFLTFFKNKDHMIIPSAPLVPENDPTLLFINAGMAPLKRYFLQEAIPVEKRLVNSQHCLRVGGKHNDLSEVGYTKRHHTFFEMLGNFSFGDYFQKEVIPYAWEFLTKIMNLDASRLYVTVHPDDKSAFEIWKNVIGQDRITQLKENVWSMGEVGPFGYCSEIFYDQQQGSGDFLEGDRYLEIWNIVFMQFYSNGIETSNLKAPCIDAGMGLERIVSVKEGVVDTYDISFFKNALKFLGKTEQTIDSKVFLDHLRSSAFLINENILPGASSREYVLRRIIRRALKFFANFENLDFANVSKNILTQWQSEYDQKLDIPKIINVLSAEKKQFDNILQNGINIFENIFESKKKNKETKFNANDLFLLHDTHGFSADIAYDLLKSRNWEADMQGYEKMMEEAKSENRKHANVVLPYAPTVYLDEEETKKQPVSVNIIGFHEDNIILDKTPFYAQGGGQIGDIGIIETKNFKAKIIDTKKIDKVYIHKFETVSGFPEKGLAIADIDHEIRKEIRAHHSSTHLLHQALCDVLGDEIKQAGSYVDNHRLRLDFSYPNQVTQEQLLEVENLVNEWIKENHITKVEEMHLDDAVKKGAKAHFTYNDKVRTIKFGNRSFELCGGSHVNATGDIGMLLINKLSSISAGNKRIEAVCSKAALERIHQMQEILKEVSNVLNVDEVSIVNKLKADNKKQQSVHTNFKIEQKNIHNLEIGYIIGQDVALENIMKKYKLDILLNATISEDRIGLKMKVDKKHSKIDAKELLTNLGSLIGAKGGGGRKDFAQTGGKDLSNKDKIFEAFIKLLDAS